VSSEHPTLTACLACGGEYEVSNETARGYQFLVCRWCTCGGMSPVQRRRWLDHVIQRKGKPEE